MLDSSGASGDVVQGNYIGTTAAGTAALGNIGSGIAVTGGTNDTIGGTAIGAGNVISGNTTAGITLDNASGVVILGNLIGTNATGTARVPNLQERHQRHRRREQ